LSSWKKDHGQFKLEVSIPANTTASIYLPVQNNAAITVDGQNIKVRHDIRFIGYHDGKAEIKAGSGNYTFIAK
jgi:hypothetical protein